MKKYKGLLMDVATKYGIAKGQSETEIEWKERIIYSICGMMAYASLWDCHEEDVSIVHMKKRIRDILEGYSVMYPETNIGLPKTSTELEDEITDIFLRTGMAYHCPNHIAPSVYRESVSAEAKFLRGISIENIRFVSGIGFYAPMDSCEYSDETRDMFGLEKQSLKMLWGNILSDAKWISKEDTDSITEYLRIEPPYTSGYWVKRPDTGNRISILRIGMHGSQIYYLYRWQGDKMWVSPLPAWRVDNYNYRVLACACLDSYASLPSIGYRVDGALVHLHLNYLLPPRELAFLKLYSWPERYTSFPCDFNRNCSFAIFKTFREVFAEEGYTFREE